VISRTKDDPRMVKAGKPKKKTLVDATTGKAVGSVTTQDYVLRVATPWTRVPPERKGRTRPTRRKAKLK
jgi:hypothetical protein